MLKILMMAKKQEKKTDFSPDALFLMKEMGKRIKFILKLENLYQNREDDYGFTCSKITEDNPNLYFKFNDSSKTEVICNLLKNKYNYSVEVVNEEICVKNKSILDISDIQLDNQIQEEIKNNFQNFDNEEVDEEEERKLVILRNRRKKVTALIRTHFSMDYNFTVNSSNGYRANHIKSSKEPFFQIQFPKEELTESVSHFLYGMGYKLIKIDLTTIKVFVDEEPKENEFIKNILETEFSEDQLSAIWDVLNANGLVLLDVNNQFSMLDLFNGKGLSQINKKEFIKIIKNK